MIRRLVRLAAVSVTIGCGERDTPLAEYEVTAEFPHDTSAYTQGLLTANGVLFESTGRYGLSEVRKVDLRSGHVLSRHALAADRFGEGLSLIGQTLYQLTWREGVAYKYDVETLALRDSVHYEGEGWGLASDGALLFMSDGSDSIRVLAPESFQVQRVIRVRYQGIPLDKLNELEFFGGALLANVYETSWVVQVDLSTGDVTRLLDFGNLFPNRPPTAEVMNGIAVAPDGAQLLVTGKLWPRMFQIRLLPTRSP